MAIQFCDTCGDTLPISWNREVKCTCCGAMAKNTLLNTVTVSSTSAFPSELRDRRTITAPKQTASIDTWGNTDLQCPECPNEKVKYTALQLRGADEGSTMFYYCPDCEARWSEDN